MTSGGPDSLEGLRRALGRFGDLRVPASNSMNGCKRARGPVDHRTRQERKREAAWASLSELEFL